MRLLAPQKGAATKEVQLPGRYLDKKEGEKNTA